MKPEKIWQSVPMNSTASACIIYRTHHILHLVPSAPGFLPHTSNAVKKTSFRQICTVANTATDCFTGIKSGRHECRSEKLQRITVPKVGRFLGFGRRPKLPDLCHAGDPVLHEEADEVPLEELGSQRIQNIIDDMIAVMRNAPAVGLAAPQIGIPLQIIVLEDTKEYISYAPKEEAREQERYPFELLTLVNPKLKAKGTKSARFFEGCLSVDGYRGLVERYLHVQVTGFARNGDPIVVDASGWKARILQHECDHLAGFLYVDKLIPRTFRTVGNLQMPLAAACPRPGVI